MYPAKFMILNVDFSLKLSIYMAQMKATYLVQPSYISDLYFYSFNLIPTNLETCCSKVDSN